MRTNPPWYSSCHGWQQPEDPDTLKALQYFLSTAAAFSGSRAERCSRVTSLLTHGRFQGVDLFLNGEIRDGGLDHP